MTNAVCGQFTRSPCSLGVYVNGLMCIIIENSSCLGCENASSFFRVIFRGIKAASIGIRHINELMGDSTAFLAAGNGFFFTIARHYMCGMCDVKALPTYRIFEIDRSSFSEMIRVDSINALYVLYGLLFGFVESS